MKRGQEIRANFPAKFSAWPSRRLTRHTRKAPERDVRTRPTAPNPGTRVKVRAGSLKIKGRLKMEKGQPIHVGSSYVPLTPNTSPWEERVDFAFPSHGKKEESEKTETPRWAWATRAILLPAILPSLPPSLASPPHSYPSRLPLQYPAQPLDIQQISIKGRSEGRKEGGERKGTRILHRQRLRGNNTGGRRDTWPCPNIAYPCYCSFVAGGLQSHSRPP